MLTRRRTAWGASKPRLAHAAHGGEELLRLLIVLGARDVESGGAVELGGEIYIRAVLREQRDDLCDRGRGQVVGAEDQIVDRGATLGSNRVRISAGPQQGGDESGHG